MNYNNRNLANRPETLATRFSLPNRFETVPVEPRSSALSEKIWICKRCPIFAQLDDAGLAKLERSSRARTFAAGSPIYLPGQSAESVFVLASGLAKVSHLTPDGKQSVLSYIEAGELFGETAIFDQMRREEFVEAVEETTVLMIPLEALTELMEVDTVVAMQVTKMIGMRRRRIERRLKNLLFLPNRERLIHLLLDLSEQFGDATDEGIRLRIKLSHQELASLIGSTRETVTVILGHLRAAGLVTGGRRTIILKDAASLAESVGR